MFSVKKLVLAVVMKPKENLKLQSSRSSYCCMCLIGMFSSASISAGWQTMTSGDESEI